MLAAIALLTAAVAEQGPAVLHAPPTEALPGAPLLLTARVEQGWKVAALTAHFRRPREEWRTVAFGKNAEGDWAAVIGAAEVRAPVVEYFIRAAEKGSLGQDCFASAQSPHPVLVRGTVEDIEEQKRLLRRNGHRSRASLRGDFVVFGAHGSSTAGEPHEDRYSQFEADYQYRLLGTIDAIRLGVVRTRGKVPPPAAFATVGTGVTTESTRATGYDYGFGELSFNFGDLVGASARAILGADDLGFATGFGGALRIGEATGAHVQIGGMGLKRGGFDAFLELHWDTVPRFPIAFGVHVTDMPKSPVRPDATPTNPLTDGGAPVGIRALLDVGFEMSKNLTLLFRGGYQARFSTDGGPSLGAGIAVEW